ncbi:DUF2243 domain-containing protein [Rhizobium cauense]|uniref:DUF2243 domain-containing protein n=1 Tax=Rhizobium cauense TaxID=1166683 RepID=UPI001C6F30F1|nr:DUF2243 domain-containing protein [Rhizobium cauense]
MTSATVLPLTAWAGLTLGVGLGGFFDGIVFHQLLQWHHLLSSWYPNKTLQNLTLNTFWDGVFHSATYLVLLAGVFILWRSGRQGHFRRGTKKLIGTMVTGFGLFNILEGFINHLILGIHHVNETVARDNWILWDTAFLVWGVVMLVGGCLIARRA